MKYLIWLLIAVAVVVWLQRAKKSMTAGAGSDPGARRNPFGARKPRKEQAETMVQCAHCGIHFPASESVTGPSGALFCSEDHLRLASS